MRSRTVLTVPMLLLIVTGCSTQKHPNFSAFQKLPPSQLFSFEVQIKDLPIKNLELPTRLPFTVSDVSIVPSAFGTEEDIPVAISVGGEKVGLRIVAAPALTNVPLTKKTAGLEHGTVTKLQDGTKVIYGSDGQASMLVWAQDGVEYTLLPSNTHNKPDLSEHQLVQVANSFN